MLSVTTKVTSPTSTIAENRRICEEYLYQGGRKTDLDKMGLPLPSIQLDKHLLSSLVEILRLTCLKILSVIIPQGTLPE